MSNQATFQAPAGGAGHVQDIFPLSLAQEGLWILDRISPGGAAYNMPESWRLKGKVDIDALRASIGEIVNRHESLRTVFSQEDGKPHQIILPTIAVDVPVIDLTGEGDSEGECSRRIYVEARRPFELESGPLIRFHLFKLRSDEYVMLVNMHHIISDAWSFGVFTREFTALYGDFHAGRPGSLPELPIQFADYAVWQRGLMQGQALDEQLTYWRKQLAGHSGLLNLPADRPRPAVRSDRGSAEFFTFPGELAKNLKDIGRAQGATLYMTLLAALKTALHRYTSEVDIAVGSPFARRDRTETEGLIGYFVHIHALRTDLSGNPEFRELLKRVREVAIAAHNHQEINFELVVAALQPERTPSYHPFFQVVFGLQSAFTEDCQLPGVEFSRKELETGTSKFDWTLLMTESNRGLDLRFEYSSDLFDRETILRFASHFEQLLWEIARNPNRRLSEYLLLSDEEKRTLLVEWNSTQTEYERDATIPELFERQASKTPDAIALEFGNQEITYGDLNRRANVVAGELRKLGVGPEVAVGLGLERSFGLVIGMLAILKAGGIYVPLDLTYPQDRLRFIVEEAGIKTVITDRPALFRQVDFPGLHEAQIDSDHLEQSSGGETVASGASPSAQDTAYIMYTSGSTGTPKGTLIPHRAVVRLVRNTNYIEITREDVFLQFAPPTFDASTFEIWASLLNGARLVIHPPGLPSFAELGRLIKSRHISVLWLSAGLFHEMVDHELASLSNVRCLLAGGDTLSVVHVQKANRELTGCQLINGYGPTENTTFSCCYRIPKDWAGAASVPLGRPISNSRAYILDTNKNAVPIGVAGELYVGGDGLSRGYLNRPELTAEKFVARSFEGRAVEMLYRTGDIVRWLADGNIEFLGRSDDQVKIRGFRVEPGEIEAILNKHEAVEGACVLAIAGKAKQRELIAYVVPRNGTPVASDDLRQHASRNLPGYMVPARFVLIDQFPLTQNGKVNRRALLELAVGEAESGSRHEYVAPRTNEEKQLARIWEELLEHKAIGVHDNFFEVGGNSLLAMQVISRVASALQVELPVRVLFETPTIAGIAGALLELQSNPARAPLIQPIPRDRAAELLARLDTLSEAELELLLEETELKTVSS